MGWAGGFPVTGRRRAMNWEFVAFLSIGLFVGMVYVIREWLLWRDAQQRRRVPRYGAQFEGSRPNLRRVLR